MRYFRVFPYLLVAAIAMPLAGCGGGSDGQSTVGPPASAAATGGSGSTVTLSAAASLGKKLFFDTNLSASGQQSCATCHVPSREFTADPATDHGLPVALGGPNMDLPGLRNTPTLLYASYTPAFHFEADGTPVGGFFDDGRAATLADQAQGPFVTPFEMANPDAASVVAKLMTRPYLAQFEQVYGAAVLNDPKAAMASMGAAIAAFETEDPRFHPFSSKYDYWRQGRATLSAQELKGMSLFNDPSKGDCAACHVSTSQDGVTPPLFTDHTYDNLGLPRNGAIPANDDATTLSYVPQDSYDGVHRYYDMGLCGPVRTDLETMTGLCGAFKVPTLRDVALTPPYFHNGVFSTLQQAVGFYVRRDTNPEQWYPKSTDGMPGSYVKYDDLPALYGGNFVVNITSSGSDTGYVGNVNTDEVPYNRHIGEAPALTPDEINDVVAFLCTLTDGYEPSDPAAYDASLPSQCPQSTR